MCGSYVKLMTQGDEPLTYLFYLLYPFKEHYVYKHTAVQKFGICKIL